MREPKGIDRHHKCCQLGRLEGDQMCHRKAMPTKHYGIRICAFHLNLVRAIKRDASKEKARHPVHTTKTWQAA